MGLFAAKVMDLTANSDLDAFNRRNIIFCLVVQATIWAAYNNDPKEFTIKPTQITLKTTRADLDKISIKYILKATMQIHHHLTTSQRNRISMDILQGKTLRVILAPRRPRTSLRSKQSS